MRSLLDVNVLVALLDSDHVHHRRATDWLGRAIGDGWASCPITENGFVRVVSQPGYPSPISIVEAADRLAEACATPHHEFWPCDVSLLDEAAIDPFRLHGPAQITDASLLALAVRHGGRFATFDQRVALSAVRGATPEHLVVI